jgi:hypothetical protein
MSRRSKLLLVLLAFFGLFVYIWKEDRGAGLMSLVKDIFK